MKVRSLFAKLIATLHPNRHDRELALELEAHIEMLAEDNVRNGMSEPEARRVARLHLGGSEQLREACRETRGFPFLHSLAKDAKYAFRGMRRSPAFTTVAVITLAIGIGVNAAVFTVTDATLFRGFPVIDPDNHLLYLSSESGVSYADFADWRAQAKSFTGMAVVSNGGLRLIVADGNGARGTCDGTELSTNSFAVLKQRPILGRDFLPSDGDAGAPRVAILSYGLWERRYRKDPAVIGRTGPHQ